MQPEEPSPNSPQPAVIAELRTLVQRAKSGDVNALPRLRAILDNHAEIWQHAGDLEKVVVRAWVGLLAAGDPLGAEAVRRKSDQLRAELEGDCPTVLEKLLVGQVVSHWLELSHAQVQAADAGKTTPAQAGFNLRRVESAQKRYLAAIKTLTTVRALVPRGLLPSSLLRLHDPDKRLA